MPNLRADVNPDMLRWARERSNKPCEDLIHAFPQLLRWEVGEAQPTLKQLEKFAAATYVPIGYFFFSEPPEEHIPIPDFRTVEGQGVRRISPNLLDTIYDCQRRQEWYKEYLQSLREEPLEFVGSARISDPIMQVAADMRNTVGFDIEARRQCQTWAEALRQFIAMVDDAGVLVMCSGIVGSNTRRMLDPDEFRGFAMVDPLAPLVFVNGADTKAAQMFTLAHELAHVWLGESALSNAAAYQLKGTDEETMGSESALSNAAAYQLPNQRVERWCNQVAAEFLLPLDAVGTELHSGESTEEVMRRLSRRFKVSTLVCLRRLYDAGLLSRDELRQSYDAEVQRLRTVPRATGGNFYLSQSARVSRRFARALFASTLEGNTLYRDAYRMLGIKKTETFNKFGRSLGMML